VRAGSSDATVATAEHFSQNYLSAFAQPQKLLAIILLLYYAGVALQRERFSLMKSFPEK